MLCLRHLLASALLLGLLGLPRPAGAQVQTATQESPADTAGLLTSLSELAALREGLGSDDAASRERAIAGYGGLEEEALPTIHERIRTLRRPVLDHEEAYRALRRFGHALGSLRADEAIDIAPGVPAVLNEDRSPTQVTMAERLLLLRALERLGTPEAGRAMADLLGHDPRPWRWEAKHAITRLGARAIPILIEAKGHESAGVRRWARWGIRELGVSQAGTAIQQSDNALLANILRAYGAARDMDAMPVVVSFVTHERQQVRVAARWATAQYGRNSIWQLRRQYRNLTTERADQQWGWERTAEALYASYDAQRLGPVSELLEAGLAAHAGGELETMRQKFDEVLRRAPTLPQRGQMASGYADLGAAALTADDLEGAIRWYRRATRLDPNAAAANVWTAQLLYAQAEQNLGRGLADVLTYQQVLALVPDHAGATATLSALHGRPGEVERENRRWAAALGALLLFGAAWFLLRRRRDGEAEDEVVDERLDLAGLEIDNAPDTLPG